MDKVVYSGFINVVHREHNGRTYDVITSKPAVAIALMNEDVSKMLLVKQYRPAIKKTLWEIPAGMMDVEGESPLGCIIRELKEEAEIDIDYTETTRLTSYYPMAGCSDHLLHLYYGVTKQTYDSRFVQDADVTEARWFSALELQELISSGDIVDGKTLLSVALMATLPPSDKI